MHQNRSIRVLKQKKCPDRTKSLEPINIRISHTSEILFVIVVVVVVAKVVSVVVIAVVVVVVVVILVVEVGILLVVTTVTTVVSNESESKRAFQIEDLFFSLILIRNFRIPFSYSLKR